MIYSVNSVRLTKMDLTEIRKKWQDLSSHVKKQEAGRLREARLTEGGPPPEDNLKPGKKL